MVTYVVPKKHFSRKYRKTKRSKQKIATPALLVVLIFTSILSSTLGMFFLSYIQARADEIPPKEDVIREVSLASNILDRNGELLMRFHDDTSNRDLIKKDEVTNEIRAAFLAAEDAEFYNHAGVNVGAITRCFMDQLRKGITCGGSTITQQVVKIQTGRDEITLERKIDEALTALELEEQVTKDDIFLQYLNITPYGSNIEGIKTASKVYFGIEDMSALTLDQAVTLASLINDPVNLSPLFSPNLDKTLNELKLRRSYIYNQLKDKSEIINEQLELFDDDFRIDTLAIEEKSDGDLDELTINQNTIKAGHFVTYVLEELQKRNYYKGERPFTLSELQSGGFTIETTLDYNLQKVAEKYAKVGGESNKKWNVHNAALMTTIPSTGEVITMAGSRDFGGVSEGCDANGENCKFDPKVNVLTTLQQPGSTNKSLAYYMAFQRGLLAPGSFIPDVPIKLGNYVPKNWDNKFVGVRNTSAYEMLRQSRNIPALVTITALGYRDYIDTARDFGYTSYGDYSRYGPSIVLGGGDVYPVEHAQGYGVFATQGDLVTLNPIRKITDPYGNIVYESKVQKKRVGDPAAAFMLNKTLENLDTGIGESISWDGRVVAGKTGTTENNKESFLVLYSPDFVTLGWAGNNNNENLNQLYGWPAYVVAPWLKAYMSEIGNEPYFAKRSSFSKPANVSFGGNGIMQNWYATDRPTNWGIENNRVKMITPQLQQYLDAYLAQSRVSF